MPPNERTDHTRRIVLVAAIALLLAIAIYGVEPAGLAMVEQSRFLIGRPLPALHADQDTARPATARYH